MKRTTLFITAAFVIVSIIPYACAQPPPIPPTATITPTASSTPVPTSTFTPIPTVTSTPESTEMPGVQVYPPESLGSGIP